MYIVNCLFINQLSSAFVLIAFVLRELAHIRSCMYNMCFPMLLSNMYIHYIHARMSCTPCIAIIIILSCATWIYVTGRKEQQWMPTRQCPAIKSETWGDILDWGAREATTMNSHGFYAMLPQIAKFMGQTWGPPGSCQPQMGPMLAPWTLLSGVVWLEWGP